MIEFNCLFNGLHKEAFLHRSNLENIRVWVEHSDASMNSLYAAIRLNNLDLIDKKLLCSKMIGCIESFPPSRIVKGNTPRDFTSSIDWDNAGYTHLHWVIWYQLIKFFKPLETFAQVYDPIPSNSDIAYRIPKRIKRRMEGCHSSEDCVRTESASERKSSDTYAIWIDEFKTNCSWWCSSILSSAALGNYIRCVYEYNAEELFQNFASTDQCTISQDSVSVDRILGHASTGNSDHKDNHITMRDSKYFDKLLTQRLMQSDESVDSSSSNADSGSSSSSTNSDEADSGSSSEDESEYEDGRSNKSKGSSSEDETSISNNGDSVPKGREEKGKPPSEKAFYTGDQLADSKSSPSEVIEIFSMPYRVFPNVEESVFNNASAAKKPSQSPTSNKTDFMLRLYQEVSGSSKSHFLVHSHKVEVLNPRQFKLGLMRADLMKEYDQVSIFSSKVLEILAFQAIISAHLYGQDNSFVLKVVQLLVFHAINLKKSFPIDTKNFTSDDKINLTNDDDSEEMNRRQDSYNSGPSDVDLYEIYMNAIATAEKCLCLLRYYNINLVRALRIANDMALNGDNDNLAPRKEVKQITTRLFSFEGDKLATYNPL